jgi:hypothetical protein
MSPALRVALSMAVIRAPCSDAWLSKVERKIWIARLRGTKVARISSSLVGGLELARLILARRDGERDQLLAGHHLRDGRLEPVVDDGADVEFTGIEHGDDLRRHHVGFGEGDALAAKTLEAFDQIGTEVALDLLAALAAHGQDLHRLAVADQVGGQPPDVTHDGRVETATQTAIGGHHDDQVHVGLAGAGQHGGGTRLTGQRTRQGSQHPFHALGEGSGRFRRALGATELRGCDHLHG